MHSRHILNLSIWIVYLFFVICGRLFPLDFLRIREDAFVDLGFAL